MDLGKPSIKALLSRAHELRRELERVAWEAFWMAGYARFRSDWERPFHARSPCGCNHHPAPLWVRSVCGGVGQSHHKRLHCDSAD